MKVTSEKTVSRSLAAPTLADYVELTKPGITMLVLASMAIGFFLGSAGTISYITLFHAVLGTLLIAGGTAAHNQYIERDLDKLMIRTSNRPLPMERISPAHALLFSTSLILAGFAWLVFMVNPVAGFVSGITTILYLAAYTPLKRISFANVIVGSVPGALPPVGGWAAATGTITDPGMWILFGIVFLWQIPHVVSIAWLCNEDYTKAGFRMLPANDTDGWVSGMVVFACLLLLLPVSAMLYAIGINGWIYLTGATLAGLYFTWYGWKFLMTRTKVTAKKLMFSSLFYLPLIWIFILADRFIGW